MTFLQSVLSAIVIGTGATLFMDLWLIFLRQVGVPTLNFGLIGRWVGYLYRGQFMHESIGKSLPIRGEQALGWLTHYAVGIAFASILLAAKGSGWALQPTPFPALVVGVLTVAIPLFVMQPAMGAGVASSKTGTPAKNCLRSLANHTVFGLGLYLSAELMAAVSTWF